MSETAVIPSNNLSELQEWLKEEYRDLKRRESNLGRSPYANSIHEKIVELIKVADHAGLDLLEGSREILKGES